MIKQIFVLTVFILVLGMAFCLTGCGTPKDYVVDTVTVSP